MYNETDSEYTQLRLHISLAVRGASRYHDNLVYKAIKRKRKTKLCMGGAIHHNISIRGCERTWGVQYRAMAVADVMLVGHRILTAGVCVYIYPVPEELMDRYLRDRVTIKFMQQQ